jgi:hypothetical protein
MGRTGKVGLDMAFDVDPNNIARLVTTAVDAIMCTLRDGTAKYQPGEWQIHGLIEHLAHGKAHAKKAHQIWGEVEHMLPSDAWYMRCEKLVVALDHAITRLTMARALLTEPKENDR